ncbi:hypothetical protein STEG23_007453 [Scotinomys teguina]
MNGRKVVWHTVRVCTRCVRRIHRFNSFSSPYSSVYIRSPRRIHRFIFVQLVVTSFYFRSPRRVHRFIFVQLVVHRFIFVQCAVFIVLYSFIIVLYSFSSPCSSFYIRSARRVRFIFVSYSVSAVFIVLYSFSSPCSSFYIRSARRVHRFIFVQLVVYIASGLPARLRRKTTTSHCFNVLEDDFMEIDLMTDSSSELTPARLRRGTCNQRPQQEWRTLPQNRSQRQNCTSPGPARLRGGHESQDMETSRGEALGSGLHRDWRRGLLVSPSSCGAFALIRRLIRCCAT